MKFIFLTILYLFCTNYIFPQDSKICWNSNKAISWSDFREINPQECNKVYSALSFCGIILKTNNEPGQTHENYLNNEFMYSVS